MQHIIEKGIETTKKQEAPGTGRRAQGAGHRAQVEERREKIPTSRRMRDRRELGAWSMEGKAQYPE